MSIWFVPAAPIIKAVSTSAFLVWSAFAYVFPEKAYNWYDTWKSKTSNNNFSIDDNSSFDDSSEDYSCIEDSIDDDSSFNENRGQSTLFRSIERPDDKFQENGRLCSPIISIMEKEGSSISSNFGIEKDSGTINPFIICGEKFQSDESYISFMTPQKEMVDWKSREYICFAGVLIVLATVTALLKNK